MTSTTAIRIARRMGIQLLPDNRDWQMRFYIAGSTGNRYTIARRKSNRKWACSCPGWIFHRHCKHLDNMMPALKRLGSAEDKKRLLPRELGVKRT